MIGCSTIISNFVRKKFQLKTSIKQTSDAFNSDIKQVLMILQEIKNNFTPTFSTYNAILSIIEKLTSLDNDNGLRVFIFEVFYCAVDINRRVTDDTINMLLNKGAIFVMTLIF